jgi:chemotaxis protein MotB
MRRRRRRIERVSHDRWLVSYADFITLLFAFFVVLFSSAQVDKRKVGRISVAMQEAFQQLGIFQAANSGKAMVTEVPLSAGDFQHTERANRVGDREKLVSSFERIAGTTTPPQDPGTVQMQLGSALAPQIQRHEVVLTETREGLVVSLREVGFFESGSAELRANSEAAVDRIAAVLRAQPNNIRIEGHTDTIPIHNGQFDSNWELSTARATEMIRLFIVHYNLPAVRLSAAGYAQYHPVATNETPEGRAQNRRVDIVVLATPREVSSSRTPAISPRP